MVRPTDFAGATSAVSPWWPGVLISVLALVFTVSAFWWLYARRGRLESYEPTAFGAALAGSRFLLRLPIVIYNTGARALVVTDLRVRFVSEAPPFCLTWIGEREHLAFTTTPATMPGPFPVHGRDAVSLIAEFADEIPGVALDQRDYLIRVEALVPGRWVWQDLVTFPLRAGNIWDLPHYGVRLNTPGLLSPQMVAQGSTELENVRRTRAPER